MIYKTKTCIVCKEPATSWSISHFHLPITEGGSFYNDPREAFIMIGLCLFHRGVAENQILGIMNPDGCFVARPGCNNNCYGELPKHIEIEEVTDNDTYARCNTRQNSRAGRSTGKR